MIDSYRIDDNISESNAGADDENEKGNEMNETINNKAELVKKADELAAMWVAVETNDGTFSNHEALAASGNGEKKSATYTIYERVGDGRRRHEGIEIEKAPGFARTFRQELTAKQAELANLRKQIG